MMEVIAKKGSWYSYGDHRFVLKFLFADCFLVVGLVSGNRSEHPKLFLFGP